LPSLRIVSKISKVGCDEIDEVEKTKYEADDVVEEEVINTGSRPIAHKLENIFVALRRGDCLNEYLG
jgi:hypothetical protein